MRRVHKTTTADTHISGMDNVLLDSVQINEVWYSQHVGYRFMFKIINVISHPRNVALRVILNRIKDKARCILSEKQEGFRQKRVQLIFLLL